MLLPRLVLLAAAVLVLTPSQADACSPPAPLGLGNIAPADGDTGIPTNTKVYMHHFGTHWGRELDDVRIRPAGGEPVAISVARRDNHGNPFATLVVAAPAAPLAANTTYEILGRISRECHFTHCITPEHQVLAKFTTGAGTDTTPPKFEGATGVKVQPMEICESEGCCGPFTIVKFELLYDWRTATDDSHVAGFTILRDGQPIAAAGGSVGMLHCSGWFTGGGPMVGVNAASFAGGSGTYSVRAFDLAGNEDTNSAGVAVDVSCAAAPGDGGLPDADAQAPDGGLPAVDAQVPDGGLPDADAQAPDGGSAGAAAGAAAALRQAEGAPRA